MPALPGPVTVLLPDHSRSDLARALHLLYTGHPWHLADILGENLDQEDQEIESWEDSLDDDEFVDDNEGMAFKLGQSSEFLTSTECKRSPIKSIVRGSEEGLGLCFVSPICKDYEEEPESGEQEVTLISISFSTNVINTDLPSGSRTFWCLGGLFENQPPQLLRRL